MMSNKEDFYDVLGVEKNATPDEIKRAYRQKAREHHPDVNQADPLAEEKFKRIGEAYDVLGNPEKRAMYDRYGHDMPNSSGFNMNAGGFGFDFSDIFDGFFGGATSSHRVDLTGDSLRYDLTISLKQAYIGTIINIDINRLAECTHCDGTGSSSKTAPSVCTSCNGVGQVKRVGTSVFGMQVMTTAPCDNCGGTGQTVKDPCTNCHGQGRRKATEKLEVEIPKGVDIGSRIRYSGKGNAGIRGAGAGDLMIFINIKSHKLYERRGSDLIRQINISYAVMVLGGKIDLEHIDGEKIEVDIPANNLNGNIIRLKGKGMPELRSNRYGDLHLITAVNVPNDLSKRERELLTMLAKERGDQVNDAGFFQKMKDLLD